MNVNLLLAVGDAARPDAVRLGLAVELLTHAKETGHPMADLAIEDVIEVARVACSAVAAGAGVALVDARTAIDHLLTHLPDPERDLARLDLDAADRLIEIAPGVSVLYPDTPKEPPMLFRRKPRPTPDEIESAVAALDARVHPPIPVKRTPPAVTPAPVVEEPTRPHADGCTDCGRHDFRVEWEDGMERWIEERRMSGRCWQCHEARLHGGETGLRKMAFRTVLGRNSLPMDWYRLHIPRFADHLNMAPTPEPWGWLNREKSIRAAMELWPNPSGWPKSVHHLLPRPETPPATTERAERPCQWCGEATTERTPTGKVQCEKCTADAARRVDNLPLGRLEAVIGLAPLGGYDVERLGIDWYEATGMTEPATKPFGWVDLRDAHQRAIRSTWLRDRFVNPKTKDTAERRELVAAARREVRR